VHGDPLPCLTEQSGINIQMTHPLLRLLRSTGSLPGLSADWRQRYLQLTFRNRPVGWVNKSLSPVLADFPQHFVSSGNRDVELRASNQAEIDTLVKALYKEKKVFTGWRGEDYPGRTLDAKRETLFTVERASARVFGLVRLGLTTLFRALRGTVLTSKWTCIYRSVTRYT